MNNAQLINQTSHLVEYYTDPKVFKPALFMGEIDLDPASSAAANVTIQARRIFTAPTYEVVDRWHDVEVRQFQGRGGLDEEWVAAALWMNHPFMAPARPCRPGCFNATCQKRGWHTLTPLPGNADWVNKLTHEVRCGRVVEACCITYACTSEAWFRPLLEQTQCFLVPRTNYYLPDGTLLNGSTKGSVVTYFGQRPEMFRAAYAHLGVVK